MKKRLLLIFILILLSNLSYAEFSTDPNDYLIYNTTTTITGEKTIDTLPLTHDSIYSCWINVTSIDSGQVWRMNFQDAVPTYYFGTQIVESTPAWKKIINGAFTQITTGGDGSGATIKMTVDESAGSNDWLQVFDGALSKKIDVNESITSASSITILYGGDASNSDISAFCWNGTQDQRPEVTVLEINTSSYNMTSDGGCISWRTNTSTNCNTTDNTPTFTFNTNKATNCSVRSSLLSNESFPAFNSSFICSTTNSTTHICTVYAIDNLTAGQNYLYSSCSAGSENATTDSLAIFLSTDTCATANPLCSDNCSITSELDFSGSVYHITGNTGSFSWNKEIRALNFTYEECALTPSVGNAWTISP